MAQFCVYQQSPLKTALVEPHLPVQCETALSTTDSLTAMPTEDAKVYLYCSEAKMCLALSTASIFEIPDWPKKRNQMEWE